MKAKWVIENSDLERKNWDKIADYVKEIGHEVIRVSYRPFTCEKLETQYGDEDCVVVFGCLGLVRAVYSKHQWVPGVWADFENLKCSHYLSHWGKHSIHKKYCYLPWAEVNRQKDMLFDSFCDLKDQIFIRPDDNFKSFNGELVAPEHWDRFVRNVECYLPNTHTMCMISKPSKLVNEWRFLIADGKVITGSEYFDEAYDPKAAEFAGKVASEDYRPHPVYVMDICQTDDGVYHLLEIGSVNGAGLYYMDIPKVVDAVNKAAQKEWASVYAVD
jgi:hypothetical protein